MEKEPQREIENSFVINLHTVNSENGEDVYAHIDNNGETSSMPTGVGGEEYKIFNSIEEAEKEGERWKKEGWDVEICKKPTR